VVGDKETGYLDANSVPSGGRNALQPESGPTDLPSVIRPQNLPVSNEAPPANSVDPLVGSTIGDRFRINGVLGTGGMSVVYEATQIVVDRTVAIKTLHIRLHAMEGATVRFQREIKSLCKLSHPNIVTVYDCLFSESGQPFVIMDLLKGHSLEEIIKAEGAMAPARAQKIFLQICNALEHAHRNNIIHRDLKPANVMLLEDSDDFVKVVDFGLAKIGEEEVKLTRSGEVWGSPLYMSPEQCRAKGCDARSDIYSLGVLMYETLSGNPPFSAGNLYEIYKGHITESPVPFSQINPQVVIPPQFEKLIMRTLEKEPAMRFQSMSELKTELQHLFDSSVSGADGFDDRTRKSSSTLKDSEQDNSGVTGTTSSRRASGLITAGFLVILIGFVYVVSVVSSPVQNSPKTSADLSTNSVSTSTPRSPVTSPSTNGSGISPTEKSLSKQPDSELTEPPANIATTKIDARKRESLHSIQHKLVKAVEHPAHLAHQNRSAQVDKPAPVTHAVTTAAAAPATVGKEDQWAALRAQRSKE
jgi:serine/threonine protein kinase